MAQDDLPPTRQPEVWPPSPTNYAAPSMIPAFVSDTPLARWLVPLLGLNIVTNVALFIVQRDTSTGGSIITFLVAIVYLVVLLATGICFFVWTHRCYKNLLAFQTPELQASPGWAIGYFFIPILSFFKPFQIFQEIWQASEPTTGPQNLPARRLIQVPAMIGAWWGCWILANISGYAVSFSQRNSSASDVLIISAVDTILTVIAAILAMQVVRLISARQDAKWQALTNSPRL